MKIFFFAYLFNPLIKQIWKKVSIVKRLFLLFQCSKNQLCNLYNCSGKCCLFVFREKSIFHIFSVSCFKIYWPLKPPQRDKQVHRTKSHHKEFLLICISFNNSHPTYLNTQQKAFSYILYGPPFFLALLAIAMTFNCRDRCSMSLKIDL